MSPATVPLFGSGWEPPEREKAQPVILHEGTLNLILAAPGAAERDFTREYLQETLDGARRTGETVYVWVGAWPPPWREDTP